MSRRKQANPKPLKRKANEELDELIELLNLPSDAFTIKDSNNAYTVFTKIPLKRGTIFGPFKGLLSRGRNLATKTTIIQARDINGENVYLDLNDEAGSWLRLVKLATTPQEANLTVFVEGNEIWCSIHCDTEKDVELSAWYKITSNWQSSVATTPGFWFPKAPPIFTNKCYPSVSRYKNVYLEASYVDKGVTEECQDLSINTLNGDKPVVTKRFANDTSNSEVKISMSRKGRSLDTSNSSSYGFSSGVYSKLWKLPTTLINSTSLSTCSFDLPTSLSTSK
ncbi:uncharacterized protein LOC111086760 [Limulus polyphemus]|uniref:Uncharacterized protein LOC111086760 n=1 Tax=Limulus polyphemus TaxID=6850 RepID=A0ABM1SSM1_LIMPO|nr:uncharacterized protein LOC111086760 [Limulus polyphemus]